MQDPQALTPLLFVIGAMFCLLLLILWTLLPFAVFGIKGKLDELIGQVRTMNAHLARLKDPPFKV